MQPTTPSDTSELIRKRNGNGMKRASHVRHSKRNRARLPQIFLWYPSLPR